jgi:hypothetical protein
MSLGMADDGEVDDDDDDVSMNAVREEEEEDELASEVMLTVIDEPQFCKRLHETEKPQAGDDMLLLANVFAMCLSVLIYTVQSLVTHSSDNPYSLIPHNFGSITPDSPWPRLFNEGYGLRRCSLMT